jgi:hypothetical protein
MRAQYDGAAAAGRRVTPVTEGPARGLTAGLLLGTLIGASAGLAVGLLLPAFLAPATPGQAGAEVSAGALVGQGSFVQADPTDPLHYGMGTVRVHERRVDLGPDFEVGPGPRYHVYLVPEEEITPHTRVEETLFVDLGPLRSFAGPQSYPIPVGADPSRFGWVVIWSDHLNRLISPARIQPAAER